MGVATFLKCTLYSCVAIVGISPTLTNIQWFCQSWQAMRFDLSHWPLSESTSISWLEF